MPEDLETFKAGFPVNKPALNPAPAIPLPKIFSTETGDVLKVHESGGSVTLERLKKSQQAAALGQTGGGTGGLTAEQQAAENQQILAKNAAENQSIAANLGVLTPEQQGLNVIKGEGLPATLEAAGGGIAGALGGAGTGAAIGAGIGSIIPGVGTAVGALGGGIIGGIAGGIGGVFTKVSYDKRQDVKQAYAVFTTSKSNMSWIINEVNAGRMSAAQAALMWDEELANFSSAERNLKKDTKTNLNRFLSGGADEASKLEAFRRRLPYLQMQLELAILNPDPGKIINLQEQTSVEE